MRKINIKVYFKDSPTPWIFKGVTNLTTEGGLLRLSFGPRNNEWHPLCNIFKIKELTRTEIPS